MASVELLPPSSPDHSGRLRGWHLGAGILGLAGLNAAGFAIGGEARSFMVAGLNALAFALLAVLAYLGLYRRGWLIVAFLWLAVILGGVALLGFSYGSSVISGEPGFRPGQRLTPEQFAQLVTLMLALAAACLLPAILLVPPVRRAAAQVLPIDPESRVHLVALIAVAGVTLLSIVPLIVLGVPPLLEFLSERGNTAGADPRAQLRETVYGLIWLVPASLFAVGWRIRRNLPQTLHRLGLVRPTWRQVLFAVIAAFGLVLAVRVLEIVIAAVWQTTGWSRTDEEALKQLFAFALNPLGALVVAITAGLGEELAVRGILQPRLGLLLPNLFFTALHAFQYNWDGLIIVFVVGLVIGLIRARSNTTTCAIVHGGYNFILLLAPSLSG